MPSVNCAVVGCSNSQYHIRKWKKELCSEHHITHDQCSCERPFKLYCFPSVLRNNDQRKLWITALKRENEDKSMWAPKYTDRVCSKHFVDGYPTPAHPLPTLYCGYNSAITKSRRKLKRIIHSTPSTKQKINNIDSYISINSNTTTNEYNNTTDGELNDTALIFFKNICCFWLHIPTIF